MGEYQIKALTSRTWDAFADLCARNNGAGMGGCWCTWFHHSTPAQRRAAGNPRDFKEWLVRKGNAHAALVFDGATAVGWCEYGTPEELPGIYHRKEVESAGAPDKKTSASFLYNVTRGMFERVGFTYDRPKGKKNCVMHKVVEAQRV
ncbi:hypothetical protein [Arthrobacter castelli]|uniref:hypothetical protein n=1 Tax=Arthrobacter castelli TaxID=271431 RepID=UPI0004257A00|nr:hypothetical protein [Arthrobacter castelli]